MKLVSKRDILENIDFYFNEIKQGKIFIYPTDTLFGLGTNALNSESVKKIYEIKKREGKSILVIAPSFNWIYENCFADKDIEQNLPGPYSYIFKLKTKDCVSSEILLGRDTLGVRVPNNWFYDLIKKVRIPFTSTSVNFAGEKSAITINDIPKEILEQVDYVINDDSTISGKASIIIDYTSGEIVRK